MDNDRLKHSYAVANKMVELGKEKNLLDEQLQELFLLGYLHDIGYQFGTNKNHNMIGGNLLRNSNYKYWKEVYYHGIPNSEYKSLYLDILNTADMMIDKCGNDVGFDKRLEDIKKRYGKDSIQYINCFKIINELKGDNYE
jgi:hypothetical protein